MKGSLLFIAIFALFLLMIPMLALSAGNPGTAQETVRVHAPAAPVSQAEALREEGAQNAASRTDTLEPEPKEPEEYGDAFAGEADRIRIAGVRSFRILDESTGEVLEVPALDYIRGAVAAEMPASYHAEALKAQAVAAHTYALSCHLEQLANPDPALGGADFSADPTRHTGYIGEEEAYELFGESAELYWSKICEAADSVADLVLTYDDQPIVAAYHAISAGQTEDAANVWVGSAPYLRAADSGGDLLAPDYETQAHFGMVELRDAFKAAYPAVRFADDPADWIAVTRRSPSGYVTGIEVGDALLHGKEVRQVLGLRSHNFDVRYTDGGFIFTVYGYGHGVGLSQYGADFMARQGADFAEILENYYTGAALARVVYE